SSWCRHHERGPRGRCRDVEVAVRSPPADEVSASTHDARGSTSTMTALESSVRGIARIAPRGPSSHVQNASATNVTVTDRPTASPTKRGWINDWITKLSTTYTTMTT